MANTISELYEKYAEQVEGALEEDRYFQYLFEMVQAGENTIEEDHSGQCAPSEHEHAVHRE